MEKQKCRVCGIEYPATLEYFYKHPEMANGLRKICKKCHVRETTNDNRIRLKKITAEKWVFFDREELRNIRESKGLSIVDVHNMTGIGINILKNSERSGIRMRRENWNKIKELYGLE